LDGWVISLAVFSSPADDGLKGDIYARETPLTSSITFLKTIFIFN